MESELMGSEPDQAGRTPARLSSTKAPERPQHVARWFHVEAELGRGGHGRVVAALDTRTGERVAVKLLTETSPEALAHLKAEFHTLSRFRHAHLARVRELIVTPTEQVLTMELVGGVDLDAWWAARRTVDLAPLWRVALQLIDGLEHLHAAGFVHRDIKAANVRVDDKGRAVLLDLGDATRSGAMAVDLRTDVAGTVGTMAPEVAWRGEVSGATDVYSLAAVLHELIAGRPPFDGSSGEVLIAKARRAPAAPATAPEEMGQLIARAMSPRPADRPSMAALRRAISVALVGGDEAGRSVRADAGPTHARGSELMELEAMAQRAFAAGSAGLIVLEGEAGIGKTTLAELLATQLRRERGATVLVSRCAPVLGVELPGVDGIVDGLAGVLGREVPAALDPSARAALRSVFPALAAAIPPTDGAPLARPLSAPLERVAALRALVVTLDAVARSSRLVLFVDDGQWSDAESRSVWHELLGLRAPVLLLVTTRPGADALAADQLMGAADAQGAVARRHRLDRLSPEETRGLIRHAATGPLEEETCRDVAARSGGHPLFAWVLARAPEPRSTSLDALLRERREHLTAAQRALLGAICVARAPLPLGVLARAVCASRAIEEARVLADEGWVRDAATDAGTPLAPYHDLIRVAVATSLQPAARVALELALARAIEASAVTSPLALARHYLAGGAPDHAARVALREAERAERRGAYELAFELLGVALETPSNPRLRADWLEWRARVGATGGRPGRAADDLLAARSLLLGDPSAKTRVADLSWRAGAWLMRAGRLAEGDATLSRQAHLDGLPRTYGGWLGMARAVLGGRRAARDERLLLERAGQMATLPAADPQLAQRADAIWAVTHAVAHADPMRAIQLTTKHLALCARGGDARLVARALGPCAVAWGRDGDARAQERARRTAEHARKAADQLGDPGARALAIMASATTKFYLGDFAAGVGEVDECRRCLEVGGSAGDVSVGDCLGMGTVLGWLGASLGDLDARRREALAHARRTGDDLVVAYVQTGWSIVPPLARGEGSAAARELDEALRPYGGAPTAQPHAHASLSRAIAGLYDGDAQSALRELRREMVHPHRAGLILAVRTNRVLFSFCAINALLRLAQAQGFAARTRLATAAELAKRLRAEPVPWARALGAIATGAVHQAEGNRERAIATWRGELEGAPDLPFLTEALRHRLHVLGAAVPAPRWPAWVEAPSRLVDAILPGSSA